MVTKGNTLGKFLWFYFENNPRPHTQEGLRNSNCSGSSEVDRGGVQCEETALGGAGEPSYEIVKGGKRQSRIA